MFSDLMEDVDVKGGRVDLDAGIGWMLLLAEKLRSYAVYQPSGV
jgi:hypothetical protein